MLRRAATRLVVTPGSFLLRRRVHPVASATQDFPRGYARVARAVGRLLRRPGDLSAADVREALAFYDCAQGRLRVVVHSGGEVWAEVWSAGPHTRRAAVHVPSAERAVILEHDLATGKTEVLMRDDGWEDTMVDYLYAVSIE